MKTQFLPAAAGLHVALFKMPECHWVLSQSSVNELNWMLCQSSVNELDWLLPQSSFIELLPHAMGLVYCCDMSQYS